MILALTGTAVGMTTGMTTVYLNIIHSTRLEWIA